MGYFRLIKQRHCVRVLQPEIQCFSFDLLNVHTQQATNCVSTFFRMSISQRNVIGNWKRGCTYGFSACRVCIRIYVHKHASKLYTVFHVPQHMAPGLNFDNHAYAPLTILGSMTALFVYFNSCSASKICKHMYIQLQKSTYASWSLILFL